MNDTTSHGDGEPADNRHRQPWQPAELATLREMVKQGYNADAIADDLGRSTAAVQAKIYKHKLKARGGPQQVWLTSEDVCDWLQVKMDWLYDRVSRNEIPHVKLGRILRFKRSELDAWLEGHRP